MKEKTHISKKDYFDNTYNELMKHFPNVAYYNNYHISWKHFKNKLNAAIKRRKI